MSGPETLPALPSQRRLNPLVGAAAIALVVASLTVVAAVTGVLPITKATQGPTTEASYSYNGSYGGGNTGAQPVVNEPPPLTSQSAPGSTTRPPAYDARQARNNVAPPPAQPMQQAQAEEKPAARPSHTAGHVTAVQVVEAEKPTSGLGAVGGAVVGGLLGNQIGSGNGRILGTVAGAAAGGFGGNYAEKKLNTDKSYRVSVKMDDGSRRTFTYKNPPGVEVGQRVHLERGVLVTG